MEWKKNRPFIVEWNCQIEKYDFTKTRTFEAKSVCVVNFFLIPTRFIPALVLNVQFTHMFVSLKKIRSTLRVQLNKKKKRRKVKPKSKYHMWNGTMKSIHIKMYKLRFINVNVNKNYNYKWKQMNYYFHFLYSIPFQAVLFLFSNLYQSGVRVFRFINTKNHPNQF